MLLDAHGIIVRNPNAKHIYSVLVNFGRRVQRRYQIPADCAYEACAVWNNERPRGIAIERETFMVK